MTTTTVRALHGLCAHCGVRCAAWLCQACSFSNAFFAIPRIELPRLSPTIISRTEQRGIDQGTEHDHYMAMQSHNQKWSTIDEYGVHHHHTVDPRITRNRVEHFTAGEQRRWNEILDEAGPRLGFFHLSLKRKAALERRRWERFCSVWSRIGLAAWTATLLPKPKKRKKKRRGQSMIDLLYGSEMVAP